MPVHPPMEPSVVPPMDPLAVRLAAIIAGDRDLMLVLRRFAALELPQGWLVSGAIYQSVWNVLAGLPRRTGIKDYDLIYFDDTDLGWEAEDREIRRVAQVFADSGLTIELRNQARVHLWFEARFGTPPGPPLTSALASLRRYASIVHAVAARLDPRGCIEIAAPFGLEDLFAMRIRPNRALDNRATHKAKAERMRAIWPGLEVEPW